MNRRRFFTFLPGALAAAAVPVVAQPAAQAPLKFAPAANATATITLKPKGYGGFVWHIEDGDHVWPAINSLLQRRNA